MCSEVAQGLFRKESQLILAGIKELSDTDGIKIVLASVYGMDYRLNLYDGFSLSTNYFGQSVSQYAYFTYSQC